MTAVQWEKLIHTHTKPDWIRLPSRLPVALLIWLLALLFPFYDTINSIMGAFGNKCAATLGPMLALRPHALSWHTA